MFWAGQTQFPRLDIELRTGRQRRAHVSAQVLITIRHYRTGLVLHRNAAHAANGGKALLRWRTWITIKVWVSERRTKIIQSYASTRYNFCSDWKLNFRGTMKGLLTLARTRRSARVCVISFLDTMCALRMVLRAYIRLVSLFLTCITFYIPACLFNFQMMCNKYVPCRSCPSR